MNATDEDICTDAQWLPGTAMYNRGIVAYSKSYGRIENPGHSGFEKALYQFKF